jgi:hypothetical protein
MSYAEGVKLNSPGSRYAAHPGKANPGEALPLRGREARLDHGPRLREYASLG